MHSRPLCVAFVAALLLSCGRPATSPRASGSWEYVVDAPLSGSRVVAVEASFHRARTERLAVHESAAPLLRDLELKTPSGWRRIVRWGTGWLEPTCAEDCTVRYTLDLDQVAQACGDEIDCAMRVGRATLSPSLAWLVHPAPKVDVPVTVRVRVVDPNEFATGMRRADDEALTYKFRSPDLDEGSFTAFGPMRHLRVDPPGGRIDVKVLGPPLAMSDGAIRTWVGDAAAAVADLFGRFPVDRTTLFVVPAPDASEVVFGKVLSLAGASVCVVVGDEMPESAIREDWVLVHELFHLGFPSFRGEGRWLGEGLATYYEPILRARAGWISEKDLWKQFALQMPRGQGARGAAAGLIHREDLDSIYWGGALFALAADVAIRTQTEGKRSLDDVLREALATGGDATHVWTVADVVKLGDDVTGTHVLRDMYARHAARGERIDLEGLLGELGVERQEGGVVLRDDRPASSIRAAITRPAAGAAHASGAKGAEEPR
jgi:hypothetical protein